MVGTTKFEKQSNTSWPLSEQNRFRCEELFVFVVKMDSGSLDEGGSTLPTDDYDTLISTTDVELLKRAWRNEKAAPDILRFQFDLIKRVTEQIQLLVSSFLFPPFSFSLIKTLTPFSNFFIFIYLFIFRRKLWRRNPLMGLTLFQCLYFRWTWIELCFY